MEVFAGFTEHADYNAGRVIDEIERQGKLDNTLIFYIWGDNGSSAEGLNGTISEQLAQNGIPTKISQHLEALEELGGLDALGGPEDRQHVPRRLGLGGQHAVPVTKLWAPLRRHTPADGRVLAKGIKADATPRPQFHHVIDIVPTIYEADEDHAAAWSTGSAGLHRRRQHYLHLCDARAPKGTRRTQFFDIMASRGIYHDGWFASAHGPARALGGRHSEGHQGMVAGRTSGSSTTSNEDWSQANDLAARCPRSSRR
jgi:arylsulfatase A-like enzyme